MLIIGDTDVKMSTCEAHMRYTASMLQSVFGVYEFTEQLDPDEFPLYYKSNVFVKMVVTTKLRIFIGDASDEKWQLSVHTPVAMHIPDCVHYVPQLSTILDTWLVLITNASNFYQNVSAIEAAEAHIKRAYTTVDCDTSDESDTPDTPNATDESESDVAIQYTKFGAISDTESDTESDTAVEPPNFFKRIVANIDVVVMVAVVGKLLSAH